LHASLPRFVANGRLRAMKITLDVPASIESQLVHIAARLSVSGE
jgi:hypothetical protein